MKDDFDQSKTQAKNANFSRQQAGGSRLPGFYELGVSERLRLIAHLGQLNSEEQAALGDFGAMGAHLSEVFIENTVGSMSLPLGIATNFKINGKDILIPMAVEETSVLAAASHGAKLARYGGGFQASSSEPVMTGQVQLFPSNHDLANLKEEIERRKEDILSYANRGQDRLLRRGGGAKDIRSYDFPEDNLLVLAIDIDTRDAMGANIVNTLCERIGLYAGQNLNCEVGLRILTNLCDRRTATASCRIPAEAFTGGPLPGKEVIKRIVSAYRFAELDPYRATTHNKGVMNGIDPVVIATGNDWRAVEAGAHAYCARSGRYLPMTRWALDGDDILCGEITLPMSVGIVGGVTKLHPVSQVALKLMGFPSARELAEIIVSVGLAQNLSALRALSSEGIQRGHMSLHQKNLNLQRQTPVKGATRD